MGDYPNLDALERLAALYERGLITQEEFEGQKFRLLNETVEPATAVASPQDPQVTPAEAPATSPGRYNLTLMISAVVLVAVIAVGILALRHQKVAVTAPPPAGGVAAATPLPAKPAAPAIDKRQAMIVAFGSSHPVVGVSSDGVMERVAYEADDLVKLDEGSVALVSTGTVQDAGHVTSGYVGIHYLKWDGTAWVRSGAWPRFLVGGSFGSPGDLSIGHGLFEGPTVQLEGGWSGQGCNVSFIDLIELTPDKPVLRAGQILSGFDFPDPNAGEGSSGANPQEGYGVTEGKLAIIARGTAFRMTYNGDFPRVITYRRAGETLKPQQSTEGLPGC